MTAGDGVGDEVGLPPEEPRDLAEREVAVLHLDDLLVLCSVSGSFSSRESCRGEKDARAGVKGRQPEGAVDLHIDSCEVGSLAGAITLGESGRQCCFYPSTTDLRPDHTPVIEARRPRLGVPGGLVTRRPAARPGLLGRAARL